MHKKKNHVIKLIKSRFSGIRNELKFLLLISIISVLITELWLNKIGSIFQFQYNLGIIYIKLCYSYLSAFIFYYLVVYAPKERKRVKSFRFVNNKLHKLFNQIDGLLLMLINASESPKLRSVPEDITLSKLNNYCKKVNPDLPIIYNDNHVLHPNYYDFLDFKNSKIKSLIDEIILLNDLIDDNMLLNIANMSDILKNDLIQDYRFRYGSLEYIAHSLFDLNFEKLELESNFERYERRYSFQYHKFEKIRNKRRTNFFK